MLGLWQSDLGGDAQFEGGFDGPASQRKSMAPLTVMHERVDSPSLVSLPCGISRTSSDGPKSIIGE